MRSLPGLILVGLLLGGCATVWMSPERYQNELADSLADHRYRRALELVAAVAPGDPRRDIPEADIERILNAAESWRRTIVADADRMAASGRWTEGQRLLADADRRLPESLQLSDERQRYAERQQAAEDRQLLAYDLLRASHLAAERPALQRVLESAADPEPLAAAAARQAADRQQLLSRLVPAADAALAQRQWRSAVDLYSAALALDPVPSDELKQKRQQARNQLSTIQERKQQRQAEAQRQLIDQAIEEASIARVARDYRRAGEILAQARDKAGEDERLASEQARLEQAIREHVAMRLAEGDRLYASGKIEAALREWQHAESLQPGASEVSERIHKAERFIERYRALKRQG